MKHTIGGWVTFFRINRCILKGIKRKRIFVIQRPNNHFFFHRSSTTVYFLKFLFCNVVFEYAYRQVPERLNLLIFNSQKQCVGKEFLFIFIKINHYFRPLHACMILEQTLSIVTQQYILFMKIYCCVP